MSKELKVGRDSFYFSALRRVERHIPAPTLCLLLKSFSFARASLNTAFRDPNPRVPWPDCLPLDWTRRLARRRRMNEYLINYLRYFSDRLDHPKWQDNFRIVGDGHLRQACQNKRPVVLAFCHFGPVFLCRPWLRAAGILSGVLSVGRLDNQPELVRSHGWVFRYPQLPNMFHLDQLKQAAKFLAAGNLLFMAIDLPTAKQMEVPFCDGWTFQMATGALRLAVRHHAELVSCTIIHEGGWQFRIEIGRPVPQEFLAAESEWPRAGEHLLAEMLPHFQAHPEQCGNGLVMRLRKNATAKPSEKPNSSAISIYPSSLSPHEARVGRETERGES